MTLTQPSTARNRQESPFLRLPPELRTRIYEIALGGKQIRVCDVKSCAAARHRCRTRAKKLRYNTYFHLRRRNLTLLVTCRQINAEARLLPFALNEFDGYHWDVHLAMHYRLEDAQVGAITNIRIYIGDDDLNYCFNCDELPTSLVRLSDRFLSTLQTLAHLRGLNKINVEWTRQPWDGSGENSSAIMRGQLLERVRSEMRQMGRGADIEVAVVLSEPEPVNAKSDLSPKATPRGIAWRDSRPNASAYEYE
jgi:hypothetical protein